VLSRTGELAGDESLDVTRVRWPEDMYENRFSLALSRWIVLSLLRLSSW
jgi:hypothetical protein